MKLIFALFISLFLFQLPDGIGQSVPQNVHATIVASKSGAKDVLNLQYGPSIQHTLNLYLPAGYTANTPVLLLLHGGAWNMGGKEYTNQSAIDLRNRGFIVANVDYRYVSPTVHGKDLLDDIDNALTFLQKNSVKHHYKPDGYHIAGVSAGAHLALLYGYTSSKNIKSITALCAPTRLDNAEILEVVQSRNLLRNVEMLADATYTPGNAISAKFTAVSPYAHVKAIPTLLFHGNKDELVPYTQSQSLYHVLQQKNIVTKFITMEGKGHDCGMNQPDSEKKVLDEIENWVKKYN